MRLLLIEDDPMIGDSIAEGLRAERYALDWVRDGQAALLALVGDVYDLLLLDLGLPGRDGLEVLRQYRAGGGAAPTTTSSSRSTWTSCSRGCVRCCGAGRAAHSPTSGTAA
jgi:two-component system OmpR family response regulator/two-component system response regulator QseB